MKHSYASPSAADPEYAINPLVPQPKIDNFPSPYEGCGSTKTCFGYPNNCITSQNCEMFAGVFVENERFVFELFATRKFLYVSMDKKNSCIWFHYLNPSTFFGD